METAVPQTMKVAILAGGSGTRLGWEAAGKPKALVEIGGHPILWHILRLYGVFGFNAFVIALGHKGQNIRDWVGGKAGANELDSAWAIDLVETGEQVMTGGRIKRLAPHLGAATFMLTWCDGLADIDLRQLLAFHRAHGKLATVTAVPPPPRFGRLELDGDKVTSFAEKPEAIDEWINGAFFVLEPGIFDYIEGDHTRWEHEPLERLAADGQLMAYKHRSFWQCMDTPHDRERLETLWRGGQAPWDMTSLRETELERQVDP